MDHNNPSSDSRRFAATAAPLVIAVAALYNWVISPHVCYLHAVQRLEPVVGRMCDELGTVSGGLDGKLSTMRTLRGELAQVRKGLFTPEERETFLRDVQVLVEETGCTMTLADFTRKDDAKRPHDPNTPVLVEPAHADLTVGGQYEQIVALLQTLRGMPQRVWIDSCRLDLVDPPSGRLEGQFGLTIYAVLEPGELPQ
jgi:hypothetical protein